MINCRLLVIAAGLAMLGGCSKGGYVPEPPKEVMKTAVSAGSEAELWPLEVGNQWVYEVLTTLTTGSTTRDLTFKVTESHKEGDATIATIDISDGTQHLDTSDWKVDKGGIYQLSSTDKKAKYDPPQLLCKFPITQGEKFDQTLTGPAPTTGAEVVSQSVKNTCRGMERVDTAEGPMEAVAVESSTTFNFKGQDVVTRATLWFVPKVGLARFVQETATKNFSGKEIFRLKSHTAK